MSREIWLQAQRELENELGREPTDEEIEERSADNQAKLTDEAYETARAMGQVGKDK